MQLATFLGGLGLLLYGMQLLSGALCRLAGTGDGAFGPAASPEFPAQAQKPSGQPGAPPAASEYGRPGTAADSSAQSAFCAAAPPGPRRGRLRAALCGRRGPAAYAALGAAVTAVIQSSGTAVLFAMSAADAGLLTVEQAVALCWGANLGTTATGQLLRLAGGAALVKSPLLCPLACFGGAALTLFFRGRIRAAGQALLGLGLTFTGLGSVQTAFAPLLQSAAAEALLLRLEQPGFAFLTGIVLAAGLQSSSAAVALTQAAAASGLLRWSTAIPLVMGTDVGTCSTALLAALGFGGPGQGRAARRVAAGHLAFNLAGCAGGALVCAVLRGASFWALPATFGGVADFQTAFNAATLCVLLPLLCCRSGKGAGHRYTAPARPAARECR